DRSACRLACSNATLVSIHGSRGCESDKTDTRVRADEMTSWRVFCAVELPTEVRKQLEEHILKLRAAIPDVAASWSRVENIHLTLKFFGNVNADRIEAISAAIDRAVKDIAPFDIGVGKTGTFRAQVLWIGVSDPSGLLTTLHEKLGSEDRAFRPH